MKQSSTNIAIIISGSLLTSLCVFFTQDVLTIKTLNVFAYPPPNDNSKDVMSAELAEVLQYHNDPKAIFIDARPTLYFSYGSIKDAVDGSSLTEGKVTEKLLDSLKQASEIVVYGSDKNSKEAELAFDTLIKKGVQNAKVYEGGWAEWKSCKLPMKMSNQMVADQKSADIQ